MLGGALAQWPVGRLSDSVERRRILLGLCFGAAIIGVLLFYFSNGAPAMQLTLAALFGSFALPVYWISFAHANDLADAQEAVNVSASLLLLFSVGAILGPIFASALKHQYGHGAMFLYTAAIHILIALAVWFRMTRPLPGLRDSATPMLSIGLQK